MGVIRHSQSTPSKKFAISLQYINNKLAIKIFNKKLINKILHVQKNNLVLELLLCSIFMENIQIFYGGPVIFVVICSKYKVVVAATVLCKLIFKVALAVMSIVRFYLLVNRNRNN